MNNFSLAEETLGYQTSTDPSITDNRLLIDGSKNVLIDYQNKVKIRSGYYRLGDANASLTQIRNAWSWNTSTGFKAPLRFYDDELEIYLGTVDTIEINAWTRVSNGWSTTELMRATTWFDTTENIDLFLIVIGDDNIYEWSGAVAVVGSVTVDTITKAGTSTFGQNRFYATRDMTLVNVRTGTEFAYTAGVDTTTLTGVTGSPITDGMIAGDILVQKIVTNSNTPSADRNNDTIYVFENQAVVGSNDDEEVYISANDNFTDYTFSSPRVSGEGALLTLSDPTRAIASIGSILTIFSGNSTAFKVEFEQVAITTTLAETLKIKKLDTGENQGALSQEAVLEIGDSVAYLSNEVALRIVSNPDNLAGLNPKTLSNPIKPDFDAEDWYNGTIPDVYISWYKNMILISVPQTSHVYMLNYIEDANGKLKRYWNPPSVLPVGAMTAFDVGDGKGEQLYGHSNAVPETYLMFYGQSDGQYYNMPVANKLPIDAKAVFAYNNFKKPANLKNFDEYYVKGEITPNTTDLICTLDYDYGGYIQSIELTINGSDEDILEGNIGFNSLAQQSLAINPLGGLLNPPENARRFSAILEVAKEDFFEISPIFSTNNVDRYWAILYHGANYQISKRKPINKKK